MSGRFILVLGWSVSTAIGTAQAQSANEVVLNAVYLGEPTDWCRSDQGVPLIIEMDGPDIIETPETWPVTVRENRGGQASTYVNELNTASLQGRLKGLDTNVVGRFSAELEICQSPWETPRASGVWRVTAEGGSKVAGGSFENESLYSYHLPFFRRANRGSAAMFATFGERQIFTADEPKLTTSQTFAFEADEE